MDRPNISAVLLDGVTSVVSGTAKRVELYKIFTFQAVASDVATGATVNIEVSLDGTNWVTYKSFAFTSDGTDAYSINGGKFMFVRATTSDYIDGTYTVNLLAGV